MDIIDSTAEIFYGWNTYDMPPVPTWHNDRMVIVGDAAHATSPSSGQGASMAIEDGVVLAMCLRDTTDPAPAFARYERLRRRRVERIVAWGRRSSSTKVPGLIGRAVLDLVLPVVFRRMARNPAALAWMYDYRVEVS
jgi:2-polyprenyl-6-methoxyphenol hydroxylase-like FAD-dependent oxidoreductase